MAILQEAGIGALVDVRAYPVSRRHPHFSRPMLSVFLEEAGMRYEWQGRPLGGLRKGGYAAHMETATFQDAAAVLPEGCCIMCAETDPTECHRSHIADWLVSRGRRVVHLIARGERREHVQPRLF